MNIHISDFVAGTTHLSITDALGKLIYTETFFIKGEGMNSHKIDMRDDKTGIYYLWIYNDNQFSGVKYISE